MWKPLMKSYFANSPKFEKSLSQRIDFEPYVLWFTAHLCRSMVSYGDTIATLGEMDVNVKILFTIFIYRAKARFGNYCASCAIVRNTERNMRRSKPNQPVI